MSSYLSIYIKPKDIDKKILLFSFSRNSDIYQFFWENNLSIYAYKSISEDTEEQFKELDEEELQEALLELNDSINKDINRLSIMERNKDKIDIEDIISLQEYIDEKKTLQNDIKLLQLLLNDYGFNEVDSVYTNIN